MEELKLVHVEDNTTLKHMHRFFRRLPENELFTVTLKEYKKLLKGALVIAIVDTEGTVCGGLAIYDEGTQNNFLNYYIPDSHVRSRLALELLDELLTYIRDNSPHKTYICTKHPEKFSKYINRVEGIVDTYEVLFPTTKRFI